MLWPRAATNASVLVVDEDGVVRAIGAGTAHVEARISGVLGRSFVQVTGAEPVTDVASVFVSPQGAVLHPGQTRQYTARVYDAHQNELFGRVVTWSTTTPDLVSISPAGVGRALANGYGEVVATVEGVNGVAGLTIPMPEPVRWVAMMPGFTAIYRTQQTQLRARAIGPNGGRPSKPAACTTRATCSTTS